MTMQQVFVHSLLSIPRLLSARYPPVKSFVITQGSRRLSTAHLYVRARWICDGSSKSVEKINEKIDLPSETGGDGVLDRAGKTARLKREARILFAEFLATWIFVYISVSAPTGFTGALTNAAIIAAVACSLMPVSGAHLNPAITFALWVAGRIPSARAALYIPIQLAASVTASITARGMGVQPPLSTLILPVNATRIALARAFANEAISVFVIVLTVFQCAIATEKEGGVGPKLAALYIGLVVAAVASTFPGVFNPARVFGPALVLSNFPHHWIFWCGPLLGALAAALISEHIFLAPAGSREPTSILRSGRQKIHHLGNRLKALGLAGLVAYGITNILYYVVVFSTLCARAGLAGDPAGLAKAWAITWAGSQVTKPLRLATAVFAAPFVKRILSRNAN